MRWIRIPLARVRVKMTAFLRGSVAYQEERLRRLEAMKERGAGRWRSSLPAIARRCQRSASCTSNAI